MDAHTPLFQNPSAPPSRPLRLLALRSSKQNLPLLGDETELSPKGETNLHRKAKEDMSLKKRQNNIFEFKNPISEKKEMIELIDSKEHVY